MKCSHCKQDRKSLCGHKRKDGSVCDLCWDCCESGVVPQTNIVLSAPKIERSVTIVFNEVDRSIEVRENSFSTFELLGLLEAAKAMAVAKWLKDTED